MLNMSNQTLLARLVKN